MLEHQNGLLPIVGFDSDHGWNDVLTLSAEYLDKSGLDRIKKAAPNTKTVAVEKHYIDKDYRDTFSNYYSKRFVTPDSRCIRLHFFDECFTAEDIRVTERVESSYLGYSVIRPTRPNCIGRTFLSPKARPTAKGTICVCEESVSIQGTELTVKGFPFASQDTEVSSCAETALWMLSRYFSNRFRIYREIYPHQLAELTSDCSLGRSFPSSGRYVWQTAEACRHLGFFPVVYYRSHHKDLFDRILYTYIESGIPVYATFERHAIALFGHLSDYELIKEMNDAEKKPHFSAEFNTGFIGNDDNGIPYQILNSHGSKPVTQMEYRLDQVESFVVPLPEKVFLTAERFEKVFSHIVNDENAGYNSLSEKLRSESLIFRIFLTTGRSFKKSIEGRGMGHAKARSLYREIPLPHFVWVCELSTPSLYPKKVLGEVLWDATSNQDKIEGFITAHYPEVFVFNVAAILNRRTRKEDLQKKSLDESRAYPIYRNNLEVF